MNWQSILSNPVTAEWILLTCIHSLWLSITGLLILRTRLFKASASRATWCIFVIFLLVLVPVMTLYSPRFEATKHFETDLSLNQNAAVSGTDSSEDFSRLFVTAPLINRWIGMEAPLPPKWRDHWILFLNGAGVLWVLFLLSCMGRILFELAYLRGYCGSLEEIEDARITTLMQEMKEKFGFWRTPRFCLSPKLPSPISIGVRGLSVIFPSPLYHEIDEAELRAILFHELAHIYHRDHVLGLLQRCAQALYWWNPFVYRLCNTLMVAREEVSDNYAISGMESASKYAAILVNLIEKTCLVNRLLCSAGMANPYISLEKRIQKLLSKDRDMSTKTSNKAVLGILSVMLLFCGFILIGSQVEVFAYRQTSRDFSFWNDVWFKAGSAPQNYEIGEDEDIYHSDFSSHYIFSKTTPTAGFGTIMKNMDPDEYLGCRVRMSAYIKAEDVRGWAGMWMRVDDDKSPQPGFLSFDNMQNRPITGTTEWEKYEIVLDVPEEAQNIAFGVLLNETGMVWVDDIVFETVDNQVPPTGYTGVDGWLKAGDAPENYEIGKDAEGYYRDTSSYYIASIIDSREGFGTIMKSIDPMEYLGHHVRMRAYIKSENVRDWAGMWMRVDGKSEGYRPLAFDNMQNRPITGTTDWTEYEIVLDVPEEAIGIAHGVLINGPGKVWFDELYFETVDDGVPLTTMIFQ